MRIDERPFYPSHGYFREMGGSDIYTAVAKDVLCAMVHHNGVPAITDLDAMTTAACMIAGSFCRQLEAHRPKD